MKLQKRTSSRRQQWFGFIISPLAWTLFFILVYVLSEAACGFGWFGPTAVLPLASLFAILTLGLICLAGWQAWAAWRWGDGAGNGRFLGITGLLLCGLFTLMTIVVWVAAWVLLPC